MDLWFWVLVCLLVILAPAALYTVVVVVVGIVGMVLYPIGVFLEWVGKKIGGGK